MTPQPLFDTDRALARIRELENEAITFELKDMPIQAGSYRRMARVLRHLWDIPGDEDRNDQ